MWSKGENCHPLLQVDRANPVGCANSWRGSGLFCVAHSGGVRGADCSTLPDWRHSHGVPAERLVRTVYARGGPSKADL